MAGNDRPDPMDFLQRMFTELFDQRPTAAPTKSEPSNAQQRENLAFALAERGVTALEDIALNTAAIRQRLERATPSQPDPAAWQTPLRASRPGLGDEPRSD